MGILASTWVEVAQYILNHSILLNRSVDINDVISNVIGVLVGYGALKIFRLILPKLVQKFEYFTQV